MHASVFVSLILNIFVWIGPGLARAQMTLGTGVDVTLVRGVNPNFITPRVRPRIFAQVDFGRIFFGTEFSFARAESSEGGIAVRDETLEVMLWGRYRVFDRTRWSPFAEAGAGFDFDRVTSSYADQTDRRSGRRGQVGLGAGVNLFAWERWLLEGGARLERAAESRGPEFSLSVRTGYRF